MYDQGNLGRGLLIGCPVWNDHIPNSLLTESLSTMARTQLFLLSIGKCLPESLQPFVVAAVQPLCLCCVEALHWYTETVHQQSLPSPARDTKEEEGCSKVCWSRFTSSPAPSTHSGLLDLKCHHWPPPFTSFPFYLWHMWHVVDAAGQDLHPMPEVSADAATRVTFLKHGAE